MFDWEIVSFSGFWGFCRRFFGAQSYSGMQIGCITPNLMNYAGPAWDFARTNKANTMRPLEPFAKPYY